MSQEEGKRQLAHPDVPACCSWQVSCLAEAFDGEDNGDSFPLETRMLSATFSPRYPERPITVQPLQPADRVVAP
ncbi:MAG TPA: hypothetical protein VLA19_15880 [Herpetosiphonaceae bacterium]|nr:hypothetical protein [Herpetosiphonaceae bacterium]